MTACVTGGSTAAVLRAMLRGGTCAERESLARILHAQARACLRRFGYLHRGGADFREDIPVDAVLPLLRTEDGPDGLRLPALIRELGRFLDTRRLPAVRMSGRQPGLQPGTEDDTVPLLLAQEDERLLLALGDLIRHRVRQAQHHWWYRQNPRHGRWLRSLKRAQSEFSELVRGKIGWHWAVYLDARDLPSEMVGTGELCRALRDRESRRGGRRVLEAVIAALGAGSGRYVLLGDLISLIVEMETADYCAEVLSLNAPRKPWPARAADQMIESIHGARLRESLLRKCSDLAEEDRVRDLRRGKTLHGREIEQVLILAVVDDLVPECAAAGRAASLRGRLAESLPAHATDGRFQMLYERARYLRRRLVGAAEELVL